MKKAVLNHSIWIKMALTAVICSFFPALHLCAGTIYDSPYVTFSPDNKAFTTNAGDRGISWYEEGTLAVVGRDQRRSLETGEHYYRWERREKIPIAYWKVRHKESQCVHNVLLPEGTYYHGLSYGRKTCLSRYYSGWMAYCADCGECVTPMYIYMSREAALSISELDLTNSYYYLCPFCKNLEMGAEMGIHSCKGISWNRYQVKYDRNTGDWVEGHMENSTHMYQNAKTYEGKTIAADRNLRRNTYKRAGYTFTGWNTRPDGSGQNFQDGQEIYNLTSENYDENGRGIVVLYAQWAKNESILQIDPAGGMYQGKQEITRVKGQYGDTYRIDMNRLQAPAGKVITFETFGGSYAAPVREKTAFKEWLIKEPFQGSFYNNTYYYIAAMGTVDTVTASYHKEPIVLPGPEKPGFSFEGWYYDPECTQPAGKEGDELSLEEDLTLYAGWKRSFALEASLERVLEPHDPVFLCGESGSLRFAASGYADKVEVVFPAEFTERDPALDTVYYYDGGREICEETYIFMIPLYVPGNEYSVIVKAYKGNETITKELLLWTLGEEESVLKEIRTRLR